jgi:hypothetical protein
VAVSASNYLIFVLGLTDLLSAVGVYYELSRILAACCEAVYLYCMLRWVVFRDTADADADAVPDIGTRPAEDATTPEPASAAQAPLPMTSPEPRPR